MVGASSDQPVQSDFTPITSNRVLGNPSLPPSERPHRVAICAWPVKGAKLKNDERVKDFAALLEHLEEAGYDGLEMTMSMPEVCQQALNT
jgi:hypothetical protein